MATAAPPAPVNEENTRICTVPEGSFDFLLDCSAIIDIECTAVKMLTEAEETLRNNGVAVWLAALNPEALSVVRRSQLGSTLGRERMFFNVQAAVERYEQLGASGAAALSMQSERK